MTDEIQNPQPENAVESATAPEMPETSATPSADDAAPVEDTSAVDTPAVETSAGASGEPVFEAPVEAESPVAVEEPAPAETVGTASVADTAETDSEELSMESVMASVGQDADDYSQSFRALKEGDVIQGTVVHIDRDGVLVDVGTKSDGIIRRHELSRDPSLSAEEIVQVGQKIDVYVLETENQDGNLILSKKRADFEKAWERVQEAKEQNRTLSAMVTDRVKGGLVVDLGIRGFVPASHVGNGSMKNNLEKYVGQSIPLKVIEVDKERRKVVLSNKLAADEDRQSRKSETVNSLQPGQTRHGIVRRLTNYGAFIDLGGIDGLLHISEMSWTRINHPQEVLKEGQELDVVVLKMDLEAGRVSLGLRQILPDPWVGIDEHYHAGDLITGTVTRVVPFGVFVQVEGGIEGIIPNAELGNRKGGKGGTALAQGAEVEVKVLDVRPEERKMTLSLRQARPEEEAAYTPEPAPARREREPREPRESGAGREEADRSVSRNEEPRFTIGDALRARQEAQDAQEAQETDSGEAEAAEPDDVEPVTASNPETETEADTEPASSDEEGEEE